MSPNDFEMLVYKIFDLIKIAGASVDFNVQEPHPKGIGNKRQVDAIVTINKKRILVECRLRKSKQDVGWIDSLIGKKHSLKADGIIGISASGFTQGAQQVAEYEKIQLFDLNQVTDKKILSSIRIPSLSFLFLKFEKLEIAPIPTIKGLINLTEQEAIDLASKNFVHETVKALRNHNHEIINNRPFNKRFKLIANLVLPHIKIKNWHFDRFIVTAILDKIKVDSNQLNLNLFGRTGEDQREVLISEIDLSSYVIESQLKGSIIFDPASIPPQKNCYYLGTRFQFLDDQKSYDLSIKPKDPNFIWDMEVIINFSRCKL